MGVPRRAGVPARSLAHVIPPSFLFLSSPCVCVQGRGRLSARRVRRQHLRSVNQAHMHPHRCSWARSMHESCVRDSPLVLPPLALSCFSLLLLRTCQCRRFHHCLKCLSTRRPTVLRSGAIMILRLRSWLRPPGPAASHAACMRSWASRSSLSFALSPTTGMCSLSCTMLCPVFGSNLCVLQPAELRLQPGQPSPHSVSAGSGRSQRSETDEEQWSLLVVFKLAHSHSTHHSRATG